MKKTAAAQKKSFFPRISTILIDLTNVCNYKCKFCWYHLNEQFGLLRTYKDKAYFFPFSKLSSFIDDLKYIGVKQITLTSEGEPTLHPDIKEIVKYIKNKGIILKLQTNGTYSHTLRDTLLQVDEIYINLSFILKKTFRILNPNVTNKNHKVIANILDIKRHRKRSKVVIVYILNRVNMHEIKDAVICFNKLGVDAVQFKLCEIIYSVNEDLMFNKEEANALSLILLALRKYCDFENNILEVVRDLTKNFYGSRHFSKNPKITYDFCWRGWREKSPEIALCESDYIMRSPDLKACFYPLKYLYLRLNGELYFCPRNSWIPPLGNIFKDSMIDILKSRNYKEIAKDSIFNFDINKPEWSRCKNCFEPEFHKKMLKKMDLIRNELSE